MDDIAIGHNSRIVVYDEFRAQLGQLRQINDAAAFDYEDPKGNKEARSHIYKLRQTKAAVEKARKDEKAASLEYGRRVDEQAREIAQEIDKMIEVHERPIREIEQREKDRIARHVANLSEIVEAGRRTAEEWPELPLQSMRDRLAEIEAGSIDESEWDEFALQAAKARAEAVTAIRAAIAKREQRDAEQAELERLRREAEERAKAEREDQIRREAAKNAADEAERKAREEQQRRDTEAAREREAAERRELELKLVAERAERERAEAERRAASAAQEAEARFKREAEERARAEAAELAKREANRKHRASINNAAVAAFVKGGLTEDVAIQAVSLIAQKSIPNITINY